MTSIAHNTVAKLSVALVAVSMLFMLVAPAKAQTIEELQAQITALMAQITALQSGTGSATSSVCPYTWTRPLNMGATGADVMKLQQFLNASADTQVAAAGHAGAPGMETSYYGPATGAAVAKFQEKYRMDILSPLGLVNATTYFGPSTMAKANALCVSSSSTGDNTGSTGDNTGSTATLSGAAVIDDVQIDNPSNSTVDEGASDAELGTITVRFKGGDARIDQMTVGLAHQSGNEPNPWDAFSKVSLWVDGEQVASTDANSRADYLDEHTSSGTLRFTGLDVVAKKGEDVTFTVAGDLQKNNNGSNDWAVSAESIRYFDAADVATTDDTSYDLSGNTTNIAASGDPVADVTIQPQGLDDQIIVKSSSDDPTSSTFEVKDNQTSDWYTTYVFDLDTKDSTHDITLYHVPVSVTVSSSTYNALVSDAELIVDGQTINSSASDVSGGTGSTAVINFNADGRVKINAGDRVKAELRLKFKAIASGDEGTTVKGSVTTANANAIDAEGADTLTNTGTDQLTGSDLGEVHFLRTSGLSVSGLTSTETSHDNNTNVGSSYGTLVMNVDLEAVGTDDLYIPLTSEAASSTAGANFKVTDTNGNTATGTTTSSIVVTSGGDTSTAGYLHLTSGDSATVKITITFDPAAAGQYKAVLNAMGFKVGATTAATTQNTLTPATNYDTDPLYIQS